MELVLNILLKEYSVWATVLDQMGSSRFFSGNTAEVASYNKVKENMYNIQLTIQWVVLQLPQIQPDNKRSLPLHQDGEIYPTDSEGNLI